MGVDLKLLVVEGAGDHALAHTMLELGYFGEWFRSQLKKCKPQPHPEITRLTSYVSEGPNGETAYGEITVDCYGAPVTYVHALDLADLLQSEKSRAADAAWRAAGAYLRALPPGQLIALYYH